MKTELRQRAHDQSWSWSTGLPTTVSMTYTPQQLGFNQSDSFGLGATLGAQRIQVTLGSAPEASRRQQIRQSARTFINLVDAITALGDVSPGSPGEAKCLELVAWAKSTVPDEAFAHMVLSEPGVIERVPRAREIHARRLAVEERERAGRILEHGPSALEGYGLRENYNKLVTGDLSLMGMDGNPRPERLLFIGSGPLPMTALLFSHAGVRVDLLDIDGHALRTGQAVLERLGAPRLDAHHGDVRTLREELSNYDAVYVAAAAGLSAPEKHVILDHLQRWIRPGTVVLARSADGLRRALYPDIEWSDDARNSLRRIGIWHPRHGVMNSVLVLKQTAESTSASR